MLVKDFQQFLSSFTDKLKAYKIPPELSPIIFDNYIEKKQKRMMM